METPFRQLLFLCTIMFLSAFGYAQTCCSGGVPMSGNLGLPVDQKGTLQFGISYDLNILRTLKFENDILDQNSRERVTKSTLFEAGYSVTDRLSIDFLVSIVELERTIFIPTVNSSSTRGFGDAVFLLKYSLTASDQPSSFLVGLGTKLSTGKTDYSNDQGIIYSADLQPGSGAMDLILWSSYLHSFPFRKSLSIGLTSVFRMTGENPNYLGSFVYEFGDEFQTLLSLSDRINIGRVLIDPAISVRFRYADVDKINSNILPNSGGIFAFLVPSVAIPFRNVLSANISIDAPIYGRPTGTQLSPSFRLNTGLLIRLKNSKSTTEK